jgi:hypothetical protein
VSADEMTSRTRPGQVPAHVEPVEGHIGAMPALDDVIDGRPLYAHAAAAVRRTMADRVHDLEAGQQAQDAHVTVLHGVIDQCLAQIAELRAELGMPEWSPEFRR